MSRVQIPLKLINNIIYARKLHLAELKYRINEQKTAIKEKNLVIKTLRGKSNQIEKVKKILKKWQKTHYFWIDLIGKNKKWAKEGGSIAWHKKWIKIYQEILNLL